MAVIMLIATVVLPIAFHLDTPFFTGTKRRKRLPNAAIGNWFNCATNAGKPLRIRLLRQDKGVIPTGEESRRVSPWCAGDEILHVR
jgi:hypothetical protein